VLDVFPDVLLGEIDFSDPDPYAIIENPEIKNKSSIEKANIFINSLLLHIISFSPQIYKFNLNILIFYIKILSYCKFLSEIF